MRLIAALTLLILCPISASTQASIISGSAPAYKGEKLTFYKYTDRLIDGREKVFEIFIDDEGAFRSEIQLTEINYLFTEYGAIHYYYFAVPGKEYELNFPEPVLKTPEQLANPFFTYYLVNLPVKPLYIKECMDINLAIDSYNNAFDSFYTHRLVTYYSPEQSTGKADSFQLAETSESVCQQDFYENYIFFKRGTLEFTSGHFDLNYLTNKYFTGIPADIANPAWWELFEKVYDKHFSFLLRRQGFNEIYRQISETDYSSIDRLLKKRDDLRNDTIRGLVILRELIQEFYSEDFARTSILSLIDSVAEFSGAEYIRHLAYNLTERITRLLPGSTAPPFQVNGIKSKITWPEKSEGKYLYLGFCNHATPGCLREFEYLRYIAERHSKYLQVVTVFSNVSMQELEFLETQYNYPWQLTRVIEEKDIFREYEVRATPQYILISPDGLILMSPAPLPSAGFERSLFIIMRERGDI